MRKLGIILTAALILLPASSLASRHSLGLGAQYFRFLQDIEDDSDFDESGLGFNASYRLQALPLLGFQGEVQFYPDRMGYSDDTYSLLAFLVVGRGLYGALGVAKSHVEVPGVVEGWTDPWYTARAGLDIPIIPEAFSIDLNANYYIGDWDDVEDLDEDFDADFLTFGAAARFHF